MANNLTDLESMQVVVREFHKITRANRLVLLNMLSKDHEEIGDKIDDPLAALKQAYKSAGGRSNPAGIIPYIKEVRLLTGRGLKEAKDEVESW